MDAKEFNRQYEDLLVGPLRNIGFRTHGQSLSFTKDHTVLSLLRFQMKFSGLTQRTHFLLCVRHAFLRTLEKEPAAKFLFGANEYPFKLPVSRLSQNMLESWHYEPINLGPRKYDTVLFGELTDSSAILSAMREKITNSGLAWMEYLTPAESLKQVRRHGEDAYCEKIWIEDYEAFLDGTALDQKPHAQ
jgi:hypothetical protein